MATTTGIDSTTALTTRQTTDRSVSSMSSEDFFKLLVTELKQQDPLEPAKTADMVNQVAQIRSIELSKNLTDTLGLLSKQQNTSGAGELLGKYVSATTKDTDGKDVVTAGIVTGVTFGSDGAVLELNTGQTVRSNDVTYITTAENAKAAGKTTTTATGSTTTTATGTTDKNIQTSKTQQQPRLGLFPWLNFDAGIHV